jgi:tRNA(Ile)-lysidine synthase
MCGRKKVGDYLTDCKVSPTQRNRQFVLESDGEIAWVVGRRTDERFRINDRTERILKIVKETL